MISNNGKSHLPHSRWDFYALYHSPSFRVNISAYLEGISTIYFYTFSDATAVVRL